MNIEELKKEISNSQGRIQNFIRQESLNFTEKTNTKIQNISIVTSPVCKLSMANPIDYVIHVSITPDLGF